MDSLFSVSLSVELSADVQSNLGVSLSRLLADPPASKSHSDTRIFSNLYYGDKIIKITKIGIT